MKDQETYLCIDTSIFDRYKCDTSHPVFQSLASFNGSPKTIIQPCVFHDEWSRHLTEKTEQAKKTVATALQDASRYLSKGETDITVARSVLASNKPEHASKKNLSNWYDQCAVEQLSCANYNDMNSLLEMYNDSLPPFKKAKGKKAEFPDAIGLIAINEFCKENGGKAIVVTRDETWLEVDKTLPSIIVLNSLPEAIERLNPSGAKSELANNVAQILNTGGDILNNIESYITENLNNEATYIEVYSDSGAHCEPDEAELTLSHISPPNGEERYEVHLLDGEEDTFTFSTNIELTFSASGTVQLSAWDSIDKEYIPLEREHVTLSDIKWEAEITFVATVDRSSLDVLEITDISTSDFPSGTFDNNYDLYDY